MSKSMARDEIYERVVAALIDFGAEAEQIGPEATFVVLDVDSLDLVELGQIVEEEYGVVLKEENLREIRSVGQVTELIASLAAPA